MLEYIQSFSKVYPPVPVSGDWPGVNIQGINFVDVSAKWNAPVFRTGNATRGPPQPHYYHRGGLKSHPRLRLYIKFRDIIVAHRPKW